MLNIVVKSFYENRTSTLSYIVYDQDSKDAIIIDPVLDFISEELRIEKTSIMCLADFAKENQLNVHHLIETHVHADHLSGALYLKELFPEAKTVISKNIVQVQKTFQDIFKLPNFIADGSQFDLLVADDEELVAGSLKVKTIATPGHTPACTSFLIEDLLFTGDALFMPDFGTGRCDFPAGSASELYNSIHNKLYQLADETKVFVGHDYKPGGRELKYETTIGECKELNKHVKAETTEEEFVKFRTERDDKLKDPKLLYHSLQVNMNAGKLPADMFMKLPIKL